MVTECWSSTSLPRSPFGSGILSVRGGLRFRSFVRHELASPVGNYAPFVSLIAPFRGLDQGLRENLTALLNQNYPAYEVIFVTGRTDDPALPIVEEVRTAAAREGRVGSHLVISGEATHSGQKVHNLIAALNEIGEQAEVIAFVDTDARPHEQWLRSLVAPLGDKGLGASSSYRWFVPLSHKLAPHLRSVWNASIASALGGNTHKNFCWGGATAVRRETFESLQVAERWRGSVSDDFTLTRVLHEARLPVRFVPNCLTASFEDCSVRELMEFTNRQMKITRVYAPHLWQAVLLGGVLFSPVFFGGIVLTMIRGALGSVCARAGGSAGDHFLSGCGQGLDSLARRWCRARQLRRSNSPNSPGAPVSVAVCVSPFSLQRCGGRVLAPDRLARDQL